MNINDIDLDHTNVAIQWGHTTSPRAWDMLLRRRQATMQGFAEKELRQGILVYPVSLNSKRGQDIIRLFLMRFIEEVLEAHESKQKDHRLEEHIDALNYLLMIPMLETVNWEPTPLVLDTLHSAWSEGLRTLSPSEDLGALLLAVFPLLEKLRNRSWQSGAQDTYFAGYPEYYQLVRWYIAILTREFRSFSEFLWYFIRKDEVLKFRLRTNY